VLSIEQFHLDRVLATMRPPIEWGAPSLASASTLE
jgi:hypothetical protein